MAIFAVSIGNKIQFGGVVAKGNPKIHKIYNHFKLKKPKLIPPVHMKKGQILTIMVIMAIFDFSFGIKFNCGWGPGPADAEKGELPTSRDARIGRPNHRRTPPRGSTVRYLSRRHLGSKSSAPLLACLL